MCGASSWLTRAASASTSRSGIEPGRRYVLLRYKDANGKSCHQKIGSTAVISLADARKEAKRLKAEITLGADPRAEAKARKAVPTYAEFFEQHYLPHVKLRKRSWDRDEELYRLRIKAAFGSKRLNQITRHQVQIIPFGVRRRGLGGGDGEPPPEGDQVLA